MHREMNTPRAAGLPSAPVVYKPREAFRIRIVVGLVVLAFFCLLLTIPAIASGATAGIVILPLIAIAAALGLWSELRRRVVVTDDELVVLSRFTQVRVRLSDLTAVHHERTGRRADRHRLVVWVAATGKRPFRIYFLVGYPTFVQDLRHRATECGARIDVNADDLAEAPAGTRVFFTAA
ncbi:hypothetical protein AB3X52_10740 [Nocardioides sp. DS6]|uniref:PH domain-containing protein n=1 Tax=Nocardioides eburneus TaxID=3231482 RepID=A0ABV3T1E9_9ACTN